jgi:predicted O-methyltransferase YrrM
MGLRTYLGLKRKPAANVAPVPKLPPLDVAAIFAGKNFSTDWTTRNIPAWEWVLAPHRDRVADVLEIGSFEGRSAICFLELLPKGRITCVDIFADNDMRDLNNAFISINKSDMIEPARQLMLKSEERFDANLTAYGGRVRKVRLRSVPALDLLAVEGKSFDLIYIDGCHERTPVLNDSVLAWPLLRIGGIMIWDDYKWFAHIPSIMRPEHAIDLFHSAFTNCFTELHRDDSQLIIEKTADWPKTP